MPSFRSSFVDRKAVKQKRQYFYQAPGNGTKGKPVSLPTRRRKDSDTENERQNGLRIKNGMTMKEKRFSFFAHPQERKAESRPTLHTFANHTSQPLNQNLQKSAILQTLKK